MRWARAAAITSTLLVSTAVAQTPAPTGAQIPRDTFGMPLMDDLDLEALASEAVARSRSTFLFVAAPLRVRGGTGSPLNPLAIF